MYSARSNGLWRIALTTPVAEPLAELPDLGQNYPNPFSGSTTIPFTLQQAGNIMVSVYDAAGSLVSTLWTGPLPAGQHQIDWDGGNLPAGLYVYRITSESGIAARTMQRGSRR